MFKSAIAVMTIGCFWAGSSLAHDVMVTVKDMTGQPVMDAVITLIPAEGGVSGSGAHRGPFVMAQKNLQFAPRVLVVPKGAIVSFPNEDNVRHHVYSFSETKSFQIPLYGHDMTRTQSFDRLGTVAIGCNIHDQMRAYIRVVDTPFYAVTDAKGMARIANMPVGSTRLQVWHPDQIGPDNLMTSYIKVDTAPINLSYSLKIRRTLPSKDTY